MASFTINGAAYESRLMDGQTQTLVLKRLIPTFTALYGSSPAITALENMDAGEEDEDSPRNRLPAALMPVAHQLASIKDADVVYILNACLDVTSRPAVNGVGWVGVRQNGVIQNRDDAKFATQLQIAWHVISENFGDMMSGFGIDLSGLMAKAVG